MPGADEVITQLGNIAVQLGNWVQSLSNGYPAPTTTASPKFTGVNLGTSAVTILVSTSSIRHGILFHNPGGTATCYVFPTNIQTTPSTSALAGALGVAPGSTVIWPSSQFTNINVGFSGFAGTGSGQPFTIVEFF